MGVSAAGENNRMLQCEGITCLKNIAIFGARALCQEIYFD